MFLLNVPIAAIGLLAALLSLAESRAGQRPRLDLVAVQSSREHGQVEGA